MSGVVNSVLSRSGVVNRTDAISFEGTRVAATVDSVSSIVYTFLRSGVFVVHAGGLTIDLLICGGGGAGLGSYGGGGGGGGLFYNTSLSISAGVYTIEVGGSSYAHGFPSSAFGYYVGGGGYQELGWDFRAMLDTIDVAKQISGSGYGTASNGAGGSAFQATTGVTKSSGGFGKANVPAPYYGGFGGGQADDAAAGDRTAGGGGGATASGADGSTTTGGAGGAGKQVDIDGNNYYWCAGGGGIGWSGEDGGAGGIGGGGGGGTNGNSSSSPGAGGATAINAGATAHASSGVGGNAGANTGSGGGGGQGSGIGGIGGSGIVKIRYNA